MVSAKWSARACRVLVLSSLLSVGSGVTFARDDQPASLQEGNKLHRSLQTQQRATGKNTVTAWVFLRDKGLQSDQERAEALATLIESQNPRAKQRRQLRRTAPGTVDERDLAVHPHYLDALKSTGAVVRRTSRWLNAISVEATNEQLDKIASLPFVTKMQGIRVGKGHRPPQGKLAAAAPANQGLNFYGLAEAQLTEINLIALHNLGYIGTGVVIGVLDTGFSRIHNAFNFPGNPISVIAEYDFVDDDTNTAPEPGDPPFQHEHGTLILGTLGALKPNELVGTAFGASFILCKTEDDTSETPVEEDNYVAGLEFIEMNGGDMVTASLGYIDWYTQADLDGMTAVTTVAVNVATANGVYCCNSAGNDGHDIDPASSALIAPADALQVITVGAVDSAGLIAGFSSDGPSADGRVKPEVLARGVNTNTVDAFSTTAYAGVNGTSLSNPLVAGAVACLIEAHPDWSVDQMRTYLMLTASDYVANGQPDPAFVRGYGIINAHKAFQRDCDGNTIDDVTDLSLATHQDCNNNDIPDICDIAIERSADCSLNGIPDECETTPDCNGNGLSDLNDICSGASTDCTVNELPDECETIPDCNGNGLSDVNDICSGASADCTVNGLPDDCETVPDCNANGLSDVNDVCSLSSADCNENSIPDECDVTTQSSTDWNLNGLLDECELAPCVVDKLTMPNPISESRFASALALGGDYLVVGATNGDGVVPDSGVAYVYHNIGGTWMLEATLQANDGAANDNFGAAVAISGDYIVVGATGDDDVPLNSGSAYVFERSGTSWSQTQKLLASPITAQAFFGRAVAMENDLLVIGEPKSSNLPGAAYVYRRNASLFQLETKLVNWDGNYSDQFGGAIALQSGRIAVGAAAHPYLGSTPGTVYVFQYLGGSWIAETKILPIDFQVASGFGASIALGSEDMIVGAPGTNEGPISDCGAAYMFRKEGSNWFQTARILAPTIAPSDSFGSKVALYDTTTLIAKAADDEQGTDSGAVYSYRRSGMNWVWLQKYTSMDSSSGDFFGQSMAMDASVMVLGTPLEDSGPTFNDGAAYVYTYGTSNDCNLNGLSDECDIEDGTSVDANQNAIPDECECADAADCDDGNPCSAETCVSGFCQWQFVPNGTPCDDGQFCTVSDNCQVGVCSGTTRDCSHVADQCNLSDCDENIDSCVPEPQGGNLCNDGLFCTINDRCELGICVGPATNNCDEFGDQCNAGVCDELTDTCSGTPLPNGIPCDEGLWCIDNSTCQNGTCQGGEPHCNDGIPCTIDTCNEAAGQCTFNTSNCSLAPLAPNAPHDRRKNRYISFRPNNGANSVAFRVVKTTSPVGSCWVQTPAQNGNDQYSAKCDATPVFRVWTEPVVHVGDCEIIPVASYTIFANSAGPFENPTGLIVPTITLPSLNSKLWGDAVGVNNGSEWTAPNQFTNVQDVLGILAFITNATIKPEFTVANLQAISSTDSCLNAFVNTSDVLIVVRATAGDSYGPPNSTKILAPALCPVCP